METKICFKCNAEKAVDLFYKNSNCRGGFDTKCKECAKACSKARGQAKREEIAVRSKAWREANKESIFAKRKAYREKNAEAIRQKKAAAYLADIERQREIRREYSKANVAATIERAKIWKKRNPDKIVVQTIKRLSHIKRATPSWANEFFIAEAYHLAKVRREVLGGKWHVDHIIPLRGKYVCGLHVENNLQVITAKANVLKGAQFIPS